MQDSVLYAILRTIWDMLQLHVYTNCLTPGHFGDEMWLSRDWWSKVKSFEIMLEDSRDRELLIDSGMLVRYHRQNFASNNGCRQISAECAVLLIMWLLTVNCVCNVTCEDDVQRHSISWNGNVHPFSCGRDSDAAGWPHCQNRNDAWLCLRQTVWSWDQVRF